MEAEVWYRPLVWTDYRLAVIFTVLIPLILLLWAFIQKAQSLQRLLIIYWRVSSLLMITVYLMIPGWPLGYLSGFFARVLIPISLWFWADVNEDIADQPQRPLKFTFTAWRWAMTVYCIIGALINLPFFACAFSEEARGGAYCQVWLEAPQLYQQWFHANSAPGFLGVLGMIGLIVYVASLGYFLIVRLVKEGRTAMVEE
ncbi:DUF3177 family protein [Euhalothece natronophila Z-M001]|uniref:DUF3177 family protein n=1 Tax=Euhalothece natronophila Z-M001 TaxID=522448 RepID=A0A5B8NLM7_9CHRO|nr:DUF3177 family protein [Euhalothece natronophila]QDZ39954.1 DUF3177 family protein [Euhalothece natronophila Z-M001]